MGKLRIIAETEQVSMVSPQQLFVALV